MTGSLIETFDVAHDRRLEGAEPSPGEVDRAEEIDHAIGTVVQDVDELDCGPFTGWQW